MCPAYKVQGTRVPGAKVPVQYKCRVQGAAYKVRVQGGRTEHARDELDQDGDVTLRCVLESDPQGSHPCVRLFLDTPSAGVLCESALRHFVLCYPCALLPVVAGPHWTPRAHLCTIATILRNLHDSHVHAVLRLRA